MKKSNVNRRKNIIGFVGVFLSGDGLIKSMKNDFRLFLDLTRDI